jgi:large repetitive protein
MWPAWPRTSNGEVVTLAPGSTFTIAGTDDPPLVVAGSAPGGKITGLATLPNNTMWAVSDEGGLYQVVNFTSPGGAQAIYVQNSRADLQGINFQSLVEGPRNVEGGRYANMLFGIDGNGRMYAFNTAGVLQPVFANGATSVDTGVVNANGIAFSNLDTNLWHFTNNRAGDAGHGRNTAFDGSRIPVVGGNSLWFGWESQQANGVLNNLVNNLNVPNPGYFNPVNNDADYNFPGGAHGSVVSNPFSLVGYAPEDLPTLYFNYFLETENASAILNVSPPQFMRDSFRVFVGGEDGEWHLLATNNSGRDTRLQDDEYDDFSPFNGINIEVQELFDINDNGAPNSWRQARVSLADLAGMDNLRLRFDFSTAGEMNVGEENGTGSYLHAVDGSLLRDGQRVLIGNDVFEFNLGVSLVAPTGAAIQNGQTFTINGRTFEFDSNGSVGAGNTAVPFDAGLSANAVALEIRRVLLANSIPGVTPRLNGNRIQLQGATNVTKSLGAAVMLDGAVGTGSNIPINVHCRYDPGPGGRRCPIIARESV